MTALAQFWDRIYAAIDLEDNHKSTKALNKLLNEVNLVPESHSSADWICLKGYILYCLRENEHALEVFRNALKANSHDGYAALYVGHCLYDIGNIHLALQELLSISKEDLTETLALKREEMILCCKVRLEGLERNRELIREHLEECVGLDEFPRNLDTLLRQLGTALTEWKISSFNEEGYFTANMNRVREKGTGTDDVKIKRILG